MIELCYTRLSSLGNIETLSFPSPPRLRHGQLFVLAHKECVVPNFSDIPCTKVHRFFHPAVNKLAFLAFTQSTNSPFPVTSHLAPAVVPHTQKVSSPTLLQALQSELLADFKA